MRKCLCVFVVLVSSFSTFHCQASHSRSVLSSKPIYSRSVHRKLDYYSSLIRTERWARLEDEVRNAVKDKEISLEHLLFLAAAHPLTPYHVAIHASETILNLNVSTGLTLDIVFPIALFAETSLREEVIQGTTYWPEKRFGREVQYDPSTEKLFVHLGTNGVSAIGEGRKKEVTKTLLYHKAKPEVFARGFTTCDVESEVEAMKALQGQPGLLQAEAILKHRDPKTHHLATSFITKIYRPGSLHEFLRSHAHELTLREQLKIASDITTGLASMHSHGYVHRDLGARNYFIDIRGEKPGKRDITCVIADMGRTIPYKGISDMPVQGNSRYLPPEGVYRSRMQGTDYCASDLFAVGCVLWRVCFGKFHPWGELKSYRNESGPREERLSLQRSIVHKFRAPRLARIAHITDEGKKLSVRHRFEKLILRMTDPIPSKRGNASYYRDQFLKLLEEV